MPELAEVEYYRKQWDPGLGRKVQQVLVHEDKRVFRGLDTGRLVRGLEGGTLCSSQARGKQLCFRLSGEKWLGVHLGMTGRLRCKPRDYERQQADHLVLRQAGRTLVFNDFRQFGRIRYAEGPQEPPWWAGIPPAPPDGDFTFERVDRFLDRHDKAPVKAVLLDQEGFPGIGNWMADEILWRAGIYPGKRPAQISKKKRRELFEATVQVARGALDTIGKDYRDPPEDWLFTHRGEKGQRCPQTGKPVRTETIGGRTAYYVPAKQRKS